MRRRPLLWLPATAFAAVRNVRAELAAIVPAVKASTLIVGRYKETDNPRFTLAGTGFAVGDGRLAVTNAHVVDSMPPEALADRLLAVQVRGKAGAWELRKAQLLQSDTVHDLALLRFDGDPLPPLAIEDSAAVREGQSVAFIGFPIGGTLGFTPVTHRGIVSAVTPIALPPPSARQLTPQAIYRLREGAFDIFQLDATAYPGNSGGPLFNPETGGVIGVINMVVVKGTKESALSQPSGISFAVPSRFIAELLARPRQ